MKYTYEDFLEIVKTLRSENGCPWDKAQTHMSLRSCLVEETFEVLQAIRSFDQKGMSENLKEELETLFVCENCLLPKLLFSFYLLEKQN